MIAAAGTIGIEIRLLHAAFQQVLGGGAVHRYLPGRGDMVSGDAVAHLDQAAGIDNVPHRRRLCRHVVEKAGLAHIAGVGPCEARAGVHGQLIPGLVAAVDVGIAGAKHIGIDIGFHQFAYLRAGGPDVGQGDGLAIGTGAQGVVVEVDIHVAGQGIGHHQRRRGQVIGSHFLVDATLEVAISREHGGDQQIALVDGGIDGRRQGPGIAYTGGAAIAHQIETQRFQVLHQTGFLQVFGDYLGAGCQAGLHPGLARQAQLPGLARHQAGGHQHLGVGGIGAAGDRRDDHGAVVEVKLLAVHAHRHALHGGRGTADLPALVSPLGLAAGGDAQLLELVQFPLESGPAVGQGNAVLGALGARQGGHHRAQVQLQGGAVAGGGAVGVMPHAHGPHIGFHDRQLLFVAAGQAQVVDGLTVHREDAAGGAILGGHVGDGGAIRKAQVLQAGAEKLDKLADHAVLPQLLGYREDEVGGGGALGQLADEAEANHLGNQHGNRLAQHGGLRLDAAHTPAQHAKAIDHGGVGVRPHQGVGIGEPDAVLLGREHGARQELQVDLVHDAGTRGYHLEVVEGLLPPAQETVALQVALDFPVGIALQGLRIAIVIDHYRVVDDQLYRRQRVDLAGVAPQVHHGVAHHRQVDDGGHPGEVLQQYPGGHEGDFLAGLGSGVPVDQRGDVVRGDEVLRVVAQQVFQQQLERVGQGAGCLAQLLQWENGVLLPVYSQLLCILVAGIHLLFLLCCPWQVYAPNAVADIYYDKDSRRVSHGLYDTTRQHGGGAGAGRRPLRRPDPARGR